MIQRRALSRLLCGVGLAWSATGALAADPAPRFDPQRLSQIVKTISGDDFEGRAPATPAEAKTVDYLVAQFKAAGLVPGGDLEGGKRGWTQSVPLVKTEFRGTPQFALQVGTQRDALVQGEQIAVRAAMDGSTSVAIQQAPLVFVGYGVSAPERRWDDYKGVDLKGKIAVVLVNDPDFEAGEGVSGDFGGKAMTYYGRWTYKFEEAARRGALGVLIVHETAPAAYGWATVKNSNTATMLDIERDQPAAVHPKLEAWIQRDVAVELLRRAGLDFEAQKKLAQTREFQPQLLKDASLTAEYAIDRQVIVSKNVVGRVEGRQRPGEAVIYSAHWDHLGVGAPDAKGDRIYNGAVDNGTGLAALIEMGRAFASAPKKPERSVVFLAVTAEERGLLGSEFYGAKPLYPLAKTVAVINMDALSPEGPARNFSTSGSAVSQLQDLLVEQAKGFGLAYAPDPHPEAGYFFRSDHFSFAKRGVPALSFASGNDWAEGGLAAGEASAKAYTAERYHQPADEWKVDWSFTGMAHDLPLLYRVGETLANSKRWPEWGEGSEFRATRDASRAERR
ncbi:Zn-dependent M28 family amino/carboxypeptidase [Variovorax boronicumulans]|uniref:Zn-dependent M28 family amino/carboxypeptidase n=1 Tax=Variovorax boronicumulans TaxID=436515 RepID=A0AAW8CZT4_9BURK|nr:M28 family metallopeptidase [Variovorax boronicumulans]MDP9893434.1 Zn-dependent M28 family amino/carboxypeptidase [Variovorax boronicumulans]MDQ0053452.1 Zn-dependent M28 family amino/carboxypeptidase [Variovorax boronicumulans]